MREWRGGGVGPLPREMASRILQRGGELQDRLYAMCIVQGFGVENCAWQINVLIDSAHHKKTRI